MNVGDLESCGRFVRLCAGRNGQLLNMSSLAIDLLLEHGQERVPMEIKSGQTIASDVFAGLEYWKKLVGDPKAAGALVYGGSRSFRRRGFTVYGWSAL